MTELTMPKLSDSMEQGTILTWLKADGEQVQAGEDLLEIETDKATVTHPAEASGVLQIVAPEGTTLPVGAPIARVGAARRRPRRAVARGRRHLERPPRRGRDRTAVRAPQRRRPRGRSRRRRSGTAVRATPLARRVAQAHGVSLEEVDGSGPLGRVTRGDVLTKAGIAPSRAPARRAGRPHRRRHRRSEPSGASPAQGRRSRWSSPPACRRVIARRMAEAKATVPHFQVQTEVVMDAAVAFRAQTQGRRERCAPSFNDLIVKAAALALRDHPLANGSYRDGRFELHSRVNVGIAVAADHALVVPTIFDADQKSLGTIAAESRRLAERVRDRRGDSVRAVRRHVHRLEPRHVRDDRDHPGHQPAAGGDPRRRRDARDPRASRRRDRRSPPDDAHAQLRPPHPLRRGRRRVPRDDPRAARGPAAAGAVSEPQLNAVAARRSVRPTGTV